MTKRADNRYSENEAYRERKKIAVRRRKRELAKPLPRRDPEHLEPDAKMGDTLLYSDAKLAFCLHRHPRSLSRWILKGLIPDTALRDAMGRRFYTMPMMRAVLEEVGVSARTSIPLDARERILRKWRELDE